LGGFNHFIKGYGHLEEHHARPVKYNLVEHAERDVIYKAAANGIKTAGAGHASALEKVKEDIALLKQRSGLKK
jgi:hypothetical protein